MEKFGLLIFAILWALAGAFDPETFTTQAPPKLGRPEEVDEPVKPYLVNLVIVIMNENHDYHIARAEKMKNDIMSYTPEHLRKQLRIVTMYPDLFQKVKYGGWTILPLAKTLVNEFQNANWFFFAHEFMSISIDKLFKALLKFDAPSKALFLGRVIQDARPTLVHHYQFADGLDGAGIDFPEASAGFLMTRHLLSRLIDNGDHTTHLAHPSNQDILFELAKIVRDKFGHRVPVRNLPGLCGASWRSIHDPEKAIECIVETQWEYWMDSKSLNDTDICYAVKTHMGNHGSRLSILRNTWARKNVFKNRIKFYSDRADAEAGTVAVPVNIPNVERGHCQKTLHILNDFAVNDAKKCKWLVITDDDTLVNTERMSRVLRRYTEFQIFKETDELTETGKPRGKVTTDVQIIAVGQRYGYNHWPVVEDNSNKAYDYLAGGAGMAFSRTAVEKLAYDCYCGPRDPDDMMLGLCMTRLKIPLVNNPLFHQGSPFDYPWELIRHQKPVTFHSFQDIDGKAAYDYYVAPEWPKKYDAIAPHAVPLHMRYPGPAPAMHSGLSPSPRVDFEGNIIDEPPSDRLAGFPEESYRREEL